MDGMRLTGDGLADTLYGEIRDAGRQAAVNQIIAALKTNAADVATAGFPPLAEFLRVTRQLPVDLDLQRVERGQRVFARYGINAVLILLCKKACRRATARRA